MATKKRRRRHGVRKNPPHRLARRRTHRRRRVHRNPLSFLSSGRKSGIVNMLTSGAKDAALVLAGKAATNLVAKHIPSPTPKDGSQPSQLIDIGKRVAVGLGLGLAAKQFLGADSARLVVAGAFLSPIETSVRSLGIPQLNAALSSDEELAIGSYLEHLGAYEQLPSRAVNANGVTTSRVRNLGDNVGSGMDAVMMM